MNQTVFMLLTAFCGWLFLVTILSEFVP